MGILRWSAVAIAGATLAWAAVAAAPLDLEEPAWHFIRLGPLGQPNLAEGWDNSAEQDSELKNVFPGSYAEALSVLGGTAMSRVSTTGLCAAWYPADGAVAVARLNLELSGQLAETGRLTVAKIPEADPETGYYLVLDCLAMDVGTDGDGATVVAYVHPWDWDVVVWSKADGASAPSVTRYALPWDTSSMARRELPRGTPGTAVALGVGTSSVWVALTEYGLRTRLAVLDRPTGTWRVLRGIERAVVHPAIAVVPDGTWRLYGSSTDGLIEVTERATSVVARDHLHAAPSLLVGPDNTVHLFYVSWLQASPPGLIHAFQSGGQWSRETVVGLANGDGDMGPQGDVVPWSLSLSACFDNSGGMHLAYFDRASRQLMHAWQDDSGWRKEPIARAPYVGGTSIGIADGLLTVAYTDCGAREARLAWRRLR